MNSPTGRSMIGGETPAHGGPNSVLGGGPSSILGHGPNSIMGPNSLMGPGSVMAPQSNLHVQSHQMHSLQGSSMQMHSHLANSNLNINPSSVSAADRNPGSIMDLNPPSVAYQNLAIPMTPLAYTNYERDSILQHPPASNIAVTMVPATPVGLDIPMPALQNIVSTVNLGVPLDLKKIALHARNAEYNPKRFAAVIMRIREPRTTALIFSSGKMVCTGAKSEDASRLAARKYARIVQKLGFQAKFTEFMVQNMVGSCDVRFPIQLEGLCITHAQFSTYEPELFPGLIYRMVKPRVVLLIFVSGKMTQIPSDLISTLVGLSLENVDKEISKFETNIWQLVSCLVEHVIASNYCGFTVHNTSACISEESARESLSKGLNQPSVASKSLWALYLAKRIVVGKQKEIEKDPVALRTVLNFYIVWQHLLIDPEHSILEDGLTEVMTHLKALIASKTTLMSAEDRAETLLEMASVHFQFYEYDKVEELVQAASEECQLNVDLTGMMGKRTRFQQRDIAQLVLVHKEPPVSPQILPASSDIPQNCDLNDDTLLEQVQTTEKSASQVDGRSLSPVQLSCLLWIARHESATHRHDEFVHERCLPFLDAVISARRIWPVQSAALLLRAELEKGRGRHVDRSCVQTELVVKLQQGVDDAVAVERRSERSRWTLASGLLPFWQTNILLAEILKSLGCTSEALLILEKLEMWDGVVECYKQLGQMDKAESLIHRLIEKKPDDSMLHVYLGDITRNPAHFLTAISLSNDRNARAHRCLGHLLLMEKKFSDAYKHLRRSLELQPIQLGTWFNAGYCAWKLENFRESVQCYHRCVSLQPDHFEAWNNLSAAYIRHGQKEKAWKLLQEALKFNYEHPNVWENYMLLSVDVGEFGQAISAYHRLLDMNKRGADDEVLELIAREVLRAESDKDSDKEEVKKEKDEMVKLLARISANHQTLSSKTLAVYALLKKPSQLSMETRTEFEKYVQLMEKSLAAANGKMNWPKDEKLAVEVLETAVKLAEDRLELARFINSENSVKEASAKVRLSLRGILTRLDKDSGVRVAGEHVEHLTQLADVAKGILETVAI